MKAIYTESFKTIMEARYCILFSLILYSGSVIAGWLYGGELSFLEDQVRKLAEQFADKSAPVFISKVFARNLLATYLVMCIFSFFGVFPSFSALFNGLLLGWIVMKFFGISESNFLLMLIPHGAFEWPAMMIGWGIGIWRGIGYRFSREQTTYFQRWIKANKVFFTIVVPLLIVAAIIEGRFHIFGNFNR
jgi:uncharacterized membrane protein SpoIIM required for sporulation